MKRIILAVLAIIMSITFSACGTDNKKDTDMGNQSTDFSISESAEDENIDENLGFITVKKREIYNDNGLKVTITGISDEMTGPTLNLLIENNSDIPYTVQARNSSVNGYMVNTIMSADVMPGKKANSELTFIGYDIYRLDMDTVADFQFSLHFFSDSDDFFDSDLISVNTSAHDSYEYKFNDVGPLVYEDDNVKVVQKCFYQDDTYSGLNLYIENKTESSIVVQVRDVSVDEYMIDPIFSSSITPGKHCLDPILFFNDELNENGITDITQISNMEFSLHIYDDISSETLVDTPLITLENDTTTICVELPYGE